MDAALDGVSTLYIPLQQEAVQTIMHTTNPNMYAVGPHATAVVLAKKQV